MVIAGIPTSSTEKPVEFEISANEAMQLGRVLRSALKVRSRNELMAKAARRGQEQITVN